MIKIKKTLLGTLLSCLMVVCLCFGIVHIKSDTKNVSAATVQTETSVTNVHLRGTNKLLFFLSASDYANTGATTVIEAKAFTDYNTLDKIVVYTTSGEYSFREAVNTVGERYYNIWNETGSVSYSFKSGFDNTNVTKLFIPAGTEFPSYAYTNSGGEHKAYVTTNDVSWVNKGVGADSTNWSATTFAANIDTAVTSLSYANNHLGIKLSVSDYANAENNVFTVAETKFDAFNTLTNITVNGTALADLWTDSGSGAVAFMQMWTQLGLWIPIVAPANEAEVVIPAGTHFPSYSAVSGGTVNVYVTTSKITYLYANGAWQEKPQAYDTAVTSLSYKNNHLGIKLSVSDYANAANNTFTVAETKFDAFNTLTNITVNGTALADLWTDSGSGAVAFMQMWGEIGLWIPIVAPANGAEVVIPAGTVFPSYSAVSGGTAYTYVTTSKITYLCIGGTWQEKPEPYDTAVTSLSYANNHLGIKLSESDYANAANNTFTVAETKFDAFNTLTNITVNGTAIADLWTDSGSGDVAFMQMFMQPGLWIPIVAPAEGAEVVIPAGTQFPSYSAMNGSTAYTYVTTSEAAYLYIDGVWKEKPKTIDTAVTSLSYANNCLGIQLSVSDYANAPANTQLEKTAFADFNTLTNITVNGTTFADLWTGDVAFINMWTQPKLWIPMATPVEGDEVVIPTGTQFPSYSAVSGGTLNVYVTTADVTYIYAGGAWQEKVVFAETVVTAEVNRYADKRLMLTITGGDYSGAPATKSYDASKLGQLNTLDYILINGTPLRTLLSEAQTKEYFVNLYTETGLAFGQLTIAAGDVVTIKKGTQFPSWAYINAGTATCYVTQKEVSYKCSSTGLTHEDWAEVIVFNEIATGIARVDFNDTGSDNILHVYLTESDYGTSEGGVDFSGKIASLNMGEYIEIDGVKLSAMTLGSQLINFWTRWGAFGLQLTDYTTKAPSYIYVKAGCQLPSLSYAKGETYDIYVVEEDTWIVYNEYNDTWEILAQAPETTVAMGDILPAYESVAGRIFLGWEINGALYQGGKAATVAGVAKAIWVDYALKEGASIRMGDTADQSGIRFTALLQEESFNTYGAYINSIGVIVLPAELLGTEEFTVEHSAQPVDFYALKEKGFHFADGILSVNGTLHTVRPTNYNRDYAARAYVGVTYADGTTANAYGCFQEENNVRNIYEVASKAHKAGEGTSTQRSVLVGYANKIADVTFDGTTFTATAGTIGSAISSIQTQSIADGVVTLSIVTTQNEEPLLIVNGKPIRSSEILEKSFATNLFTVSFLYETESNLTYYASDDAMQQFFQDYFELYTMSGQYAVTHSPVSNGPTYQQDWYMNAISWFNATNLVVNENSATQNGTYSAEAYALYYLNNIDIDKNGNVYADMNDKSFSTADGGPAYSTVTSYYLMSSQGWALPNMESIGWKAYHAEFNANVTDTTLSKELSSQSGYATAQESSKGWKVNGSAVTQSNGVAGYVGTAKTGLSNVTGATNAIVYEVTDISYSAFNAPFVEVRLLLDDPNAVITDYAIEWQTGGSWYSVKQSEYANNPYEMPNATGMYRSHFPLYTHANYGAGRLITSNESASNHKTITGLRVVLIAKDTTTSVTAKLDYVRATADSRHSVNGPKYVVALNEYASNHNDIELLVNNITRARRAMLFQLEPLQGKNGLVNLSYLHRHDSYQGAPNSYWDIYPAGCLNTEANVYFYEGLLALADMEEALAKQGITVTETASIEWHDLSGAKQTATYTHTADSLRTLAETVKGNIQTTFYNGTTGRFAWSVRDVDSESGNKEGTLMDYGFTELNLHAVEAGVADTDQAASIMSWINGTRKVSGDKVSGNGIYEQPFAPVTTTADNQKYTIDGSNITSVRESDFSEYYYDKKYGVQCQDGGTIMHVSYYDILARAKALGVENAYGRISAIANWFVEVQKKNPNAATAGWADFFKNYYTASGDLQGSGTAGKYGLQDEFKEAVMVMATAPKIFLGLDARYDTLTIAPNLGSLTHFGMENLAFGEKTYTCYATASSIALSGIAGNANSGLKVTLKLKYTAGQSVYLNGKLLDSGEYTVEGDYVTVTTDFANLTLQVK